jgi:hypothetical protein
LRKPEGQDAARETGIDGRALLATLCVSSLPAFAAVVSLTRWGATARTDSADYTGSLPGGCNILELALQESDPVGGSQNSSAVI